MDWKISAIYLGNISFTFFIRIQWIISLETLLTCEGNVNEILYVSSFSHFLCSVMENTHILKGWNVKEWKVVTNSITITIKEWTHSFDNSSIYRMQFYREKKKEKNFSEEAWKIKTWFRLSIFLLIYFFSFHSCRFSFRSHHFAALLLRRLHIFTYKKKYLSLSLSYSFTRIFAYRQFSLMLFYFKCARKMEKIREIEKEGRKKNPSKDEDDIKLCKEMLQC